MHTVWRGLLAGTLLGFLGVSLLSAATSPGPVVATRQAPFTNSLGMQFVPVPGTPALFSIWETRVQDFAAFVKDTGYQAIGEVYSLGTNRWKLRGDWWESPGFEQSALHPVCAVSWRDAQAFLEWLSKKEGRRYRLPTDIEWSQAVGIPGEVGASPKERSGRIPEHFPWGRALPPLVNGLPAGNYPGAEASVTNWPISFRVIENYHDAFPRTAPVGSFPPNPFGLHDLGGNVWEWCEDQWDPPRDMRVVRGASWVDNLPEILSTSYRHPGRPEMRNTSVGFRAVLDPTAPATPTATPPP